MSDQKKVCTSWSKNSQEKIEISHVWVIERFQFRKEDALYSAKFSSPREESYRKKEWKIKLCPGEKEGRKGSISLYLTLANPREEEFEVTQAFSLIDESGKCLKEQGVKTVHTFSKTKSDCGMINFCKRDDILSKLTNHVLKVKCSLSYFSDSKTASGSGQFSPLKKEKEQAPDESSQYNFSDNMAALLTGHQFYDVTLCVIGGEGEGTREFKAHKNILSVRSPYFAAMLSDDFKEKVENKVEIKEIKPEVFKEILSFIYTGKTSKNVTENVAKELLVAADRFALDGLKETVRGLLVERVNVKNALGLLVLGHTHSIENLKTKATELVASNANKVMKTEDWEQMVREHPQLMEPILTEVSKKIEQKESRRRRYDDYY